MAIVTNGRLEYEMSAIDVTYPDVGKVTYRGSYPLIVPNQWAPPKEKCDNCLTFTGKDSEFTLKATNKTWDGTLEWSTDQYTWTALVGTEEIQSADKKLYLRGKENTKFYDNTNRNGVKWVLSEKADCSGNIQTLLDWENPPESINTEDCYIQMFNGCTNLTTAPELPATTLAKFCYGSMFMNCTNLTSAPKLPATTLKDNCYLSMFYGCESLTNAPELPVTTLAGFCYYSMFYGCTNLIHAPKLPATTLANYCYKDMFFGCTKLTTAPTLPATTLAEYCYDGMFFQCTNLTTAPELPATSLKKYCYRDMFNKCTSLTTAPVLPATTVKRECYKGMFYGCTNLTAAPELPATSLSDFCYEMMFWGCSKLKVNATSGNKIFTYPSTTPSYVNDPVKNMFNGTGGTFTGTPVAGETYYWTE